MNAELAVRTARAEIERDEALEQLRLCREALRAFTLKDKEAMLDTLHIIGIPARDLADIYRLEQDWRKLGGGRRLLDLLIEMEELRETVQYLADIHHRTLTNSSFHGPEQREWYECSCVTCRRAQRVAKRV